ncbi:HAD family hydrolase [Denitrobacterium detoxificans]|uniref:Haloacid dehalogenase-like hydrolase n=2 Tax=Denitrobacterium detoxificans TaxID=79604 RepID=A0A1H8T757_9ACTN|nr:HAD family hydrolase [Denitrobacterium detoxificans]SEO86762.1 hypothetical protein SAMN02910314_01430 [Denitrobacterium detoxificans]
MIVLACASGAVACSGQGSSGGGTPSEMESADVKTLYVSGTSFAPATEAAINDFIATYGKDSPDWNESAYVVCDFDNTTAIFDITYQCNAYQIQTMAFAVDPAGLRAALSSEINPEADDNNLWLDDIENAYQYLWTIYGPFTSSGLDEEAQKAIQADPEWMEFAAKMKAFYEHVEDTIDDPTACAWVLNWYSGMSEQEVYNLYMRSCETYRDVDTVDVVWESPASIASEVGVASSEFPLGVSVTEDVREMLKAYSDNGIDVWICSASHADGVRAAVDAYGLSESVHGIIGMTQKLSDGIYVPAYDWDEGYAWLNSGNGTWEKTDMAIHALPSREGKVQAIENTLVPLYGAGPLAGFMDSSGDYNFCTEFDSMKMVICYNRANRKITEGAGIVAAVAVYQQDVLNYDLASANAAGDTYYLLQGRDENGKRTLRPSDETVRLGSSEPKLFANEDNDALLSYIEAHGMTTAQVFGTFSVRCDASDPNNKLGVTYGYLDEYSGYHSHR